MKYLVVSDIHGSKFYINKLEEIIKRELPDKIIILGDIFSHINLVDEEISDTLNKYCGIILCTKGNCDNDRDIERCKFKVYDHIKLMINNNLCFFTHGDHYNINSLPSMVKVFIYGHLHTGFIRYDNNILQVNSGSLSYPRGSSTNSYCIIDDKGILLKDIDSSVIDEFLFEWM